MKRLLTQAEDLVGKTIKFAEMDGEELLLSFTDDTWAFLDIYRDYNRPFLEFVAVDVVYDRLTCEQFLRMEIITKSEYQQKQEEWESSFRAEAERREAQERREYERLKKKYAEAGHGG